MSELQSNHISTVRAHMIDQLVALRAAKPGEELDAEIKRAKGVSDVAQTIINSAKVEIDYLTVTGQGKASFLEMPPATPQITGQVDSPGRIDGASNGIVSITRHHLRG